MKFLPILMFVALMLGGTFGCFVQPPLQEVQRHGAAAADDKPVQPADEDATLEIEVIGTYRNGDADFVREQIEAILPEGIRRRGWSASGNRFKYDVSPTIDTNALAKQIRFGKVLDVDPRKIRVQYSYDNAVPARLRKEPTGFHKPPEDELGPALKKHNGDWWAALEELRATRQKNEQGEIIHLDLPSFKTTDQTLAHVAELTSLQELEMSMCRHVTDEGAQYLAKLTDLEDLDLFATSIGNPGQSHLRNLTKLRRLQLSGSGTEDGLRHIAGLTNLESLSIGFGLGYPVTTVGLDNLKEMTNLTRLRLDGCEISDEGLKIIAGFPKLESLQLQGGTMTDAGLAHLSGLVSLRSLNLDHCSEIGGEGVAHLRPLVDLTYLNLGGTQLTDRGIEHLNDLQQLSSLTLSETGVTDAGVRTLGPLPNLKQLILDGTAVTDASLEHIKSFPKLDNIWLSDTAITDEGLKQLAEMKQLRALQIDGTEITDAGMAHLAGLTELRTIDFGNTAVSERGLQHLSGATNLRDIRAEDTGVTREAIQRFKAQ